MLMFFSRRLDFLFVCFFPLAQLQEATKSQTHSDSLNLSQRLIAVSLVRKLDKSLALAVASLQETDSKYYKGKTKKRQTFWKMEHQLNICVVITHVEWNVFGQNTTYNIIQHK